MYAKIAAVGTTPAKLVFFYNRDDIFNDVALLSNYMSKNLATKEGAPLTDEFAISDDEKELVNTCVRSALPDIYEPMAKITSGVIPAFKEDVTENAGTKGKDIENNDVPIAAGHYVEFYMLDNEAYNANTILLVDESLRNIINYGTLKEVYSTIVNPDLLKICGERFVGEVLKLKQRLFQLKKKSVVSNLG